jgi:FkbM family methyltransferase
MIRLHVLAVPHTASTKEYTVCAFTQKVINFCKMYKEQGMYVIHYGHEASNVICDEHVIVTTQKLLDDAYGVYDWKNQGLKFQMGDIVQRTFNENAIREIGLRKQPGDIILCFFGNAQQSVVEAHPDLFGCEPSIGYPSAFAPYKVYESYAVMHGLQGQKRIAEAEYKFYDAVIPSGFDLSEFEFRDKKDDYFLMCGRIVWSKGVDIAAQVCEKLGVKLILAGTSYGPKDCNLGDKWPDHVSYVGYADVEKRKRLMAGAKGLFCPTIYNEPFGYVAIEAMLSGTPVITVDWGAFTETVQHGVTGYRCRTFEQFLWAAKNIHTISPWACREWAVKNYSFEKVGKMYKEYFQSLQNLTLKGWYTENDNRKELEWLTKEQPQQPKTFDNILRLLNNNQNGKVKFIQIGAMDGVKFDDLYLYIKNFNWSGYLVEPLPDKFEKLMSNYQDVEGLSFECSAITNFDGEVEIYTVPQEKIDDGTVEEWAEGCSTLKPKTHIEHLTPHMVTKLVNAMTFDTFTKKWDIENNEIDFIQVDTEGSDYDIMMQIMNSGVRPKLFKIEIAHITYNKAVYIRWLLEKENYKTFIDGYDLVAYRF